MPSRPRTPPSQRPRGRAPHRVVRAALAVLLGALALAPAPAHAQRAPRSRGPASPQPAPTPPAPPAPPAEAPAPSLAESREVREAREHQQLGRRLLDANNFNGALAEFQRVYELLEGHPRRYTALANIGRCHQSLGQYDLAVRSYEQYLTEAPAEVPERAQVDAALGALRDLLGTLDVRVAGPAQAEVWVDNRLAGTAPGRVRVTGGQHVVELRAAGYLPSRTQVSITAREERALALTLTRPSASRGLPRGVFFGAVGATAAAGVGATIFGALALSARGAAQARLALPETDPERFNLTADELRQAGPPALAADLLLGATALFATGAVVLGLLTDWRGGATQERARRAPRTPPLLVLPDGRGGAVLTGAF